MMKYHQLTTFVIGDPVRLKSGGPEMLIVDFDGLDAKVSHPDPDHKLCVIHSIFPIVCLKKI